MEHSQRFTLPYRGSRYAFPLPRPATGRSTAGRILRGLPVSSPTFLLKQNPPGRPSPQGRRD